MNRNPANIKGKVSSKKNKFVNVSSQEGSGGSKIADTDKAQNGQSVSSVQLSVIDKNGPAIALVTKPPVS